MKGFYSITILAIVAIILMFFAYAMISIGNQRKSSVAVMESDMVAEKATAAAGFFNSTIHDAIADSSFEAYNCTVQPQNFCSYLNSTLASYFSTSSLILSNQSYSTIGFNSTPPVLTCVSITSNPPNNYTFTVSVSYAFTSNFSGFSKNVSENQNWNVFIQNYTPAYLNLSNGGNGAVCTPEKLFEVNTSDFALSVNCSETPISTTC
ncbi:MAG: hypothetical protein M1594_00860 [Candidatus Marsarchaeota archaeon]|nr:hypothetical protein [Candidatus Marsarchaeota archaeon]